MDKLNVFFGRRQWLSTMIINDDNTIWDKVSADIKKEFDSDPVYNKEVLKTKGVFKSYLFSSNQLGFCSQKR